MSCTLEGRGMNEYLWNTFCVPGVSINTAKFISTTAFWVYASSLFSSFLFVWMKKWKLRKVEMSKMFPLVFYSHAQPYMTWLLPLLSSIVISIIIVIVASWFLWRCPQIAAIASEKGWALMLQVAIRVSRICHLSHTVYFVCTQVYLSRWLPEIPSNYP